MMMPQEEESSAPQKPPEYGRYEGGQISSTRQYYEIPDAQEVREEPSSKVYPRPRDHANTLSFILLMIALTLFVLSGYFFVVVVGGLVGLVSFAAACFVICCLLAYSWSMRAQAR